MIESDYRTATRKVSNRHEAENGGKSLETLVCAGDGPRL